MANGSFHDELLSVHKTQTVSLTHRDAPDSTVAADPFVQLIQIVFLHTVGRVGDNPMHSIFWHTAQPFQAISVHQQRPANPFTLVIEREPWQNGWFVLHVRQTLSALTT